MFSFRSISARTRAILTSHKGRTRVRHAAAFSHIAYCGAVFLEGHGTYPLLAGVVGVCIVFELLTGEG